jgi:two-component system sensor histidine kinase KdpD
VTTRTRPGHALAALALLLAAAVRIGIDPTPASPWRHLLLVPALAAGLRLGLVGGVVAGSGATLLEALSVLPALERAGPSAVADGLVALALPIALGALSGGLAARAARARARHALSVAVQRVLADATTLDAALLRLRDCLARHLDGAVALAALDGERLVLAGAASVAERSLAARVLASGAPAWAPDVGGGRGPRRALVVPLVAGTEPIGVLALERDGELGREEQAALAALGAHAGLALENARLASLQRRAAEELARRVDEATVRLREMDRLKSDFVAIASHELRTPLTALAGFSELLAARRFPPEEIRRLADVMRGETVRLARIVSDILDLSRLERGLEPVLRRAPVAVEAVAAGALEVFRRGAPTHRFELRHAEPVPLADADPDALERILANLVSNAVKYSPAGSCVRLACRGIDEGRRVEVTVEDEGGGVPPDALERIFEPYYRAPGAARAAHGTGIGLAVVRSLVEAHGGTIRAENVAARGTRMTLTLPAVP